VFDDRAVRLITTFQGAGVLNGDLTPECAEAVAAVLDALAAPAGAEDTRTQEQRYHDALQEAMRWLVKCIVMPVTPRRYGCGTCDRPRRGGCRRCSPAGSFREPNGPGPSQDQDRSGVVLSRRR
jgi:hypothetical protein